MSNQLSSFRSKSSQSFGKTRPRGILSNIASGSSVVGSSALSAISSVLPSLTFEPELKRVGPYNAKKEERKRELRRKTYSKLASDNREKKKQNREAEINTIFKKMAQKLMNQKRIKAKLQPIQIRSTSRRNVVKLPENINHNSSISSLSELSELSELYYNLNKPIILGNITHLVNKRPSGKYPSGRVSNPKRNFVHSNIKPNLENNYRPNSTKVSKKHINLLNSKRRNRNYSLQEDV